MTINLISPIGLEPWDYRNPDGPGIGGSETAHIEMDKFLSAVGHTVWNFAPVPEESKNWFDVKTPKQEITEDPAINIVYRDASFFDGPLGPGKYWFVAQDCDAPWTEERLAKVDRYITLCDEHTKYTLSRYPSLAGRIFQSTNGIRVSEMEELEKLYSCKRNPKRVIYASSPDRGLVHLLNSWPRLLEYVPDAELHVFYGFNNMKYLIDHGHPQLQKIVDDVEAAINLPIQNRVTIHGRKPQKELWKEILASGIWWYPTNWAESSCITSMEMQALGAVPVSTDFWAVGQNVLFGGLTEQIPQINATAAAEQIHLVADLMRHPEIQDGIREKMMPAIRERFDWRRVGEQWEEWIKEDADKIESNRNRGENVERESAAGVCGFTRSDGPILPTVLM